MKKNKIKRFGEYTTKKDYHLNLDPKWPFLPVYLEKMDYVDKLIESFSKRHRIIDLGCGEGVLVKKYYKKGFNIVGLDLNYQSTLVTKGDITNLPYQDKSFNAVLCLDVLEHLNFHDQNKTLKEIIRILKPDGKLLLSLPNLAHLASRFSFLFAGKLLRTSGIDRHPGDRPLAEYKKILKPYFKIIRIKGLFPTLPLISIFTLLIPSKIIWWHKIYNRLLAWPPICFENIILTQKLPK